ncbi:hypothetical protein CYMTET_5692 [Cymbomonas tetramitiformis]|uniref:Uncharacterized protein n=1 Tax=Cymbomonas tetramitiformis TaxID=36881 RepID=A0AAE0LIL9_9CHLO|nr:hypothetical protein CYMTET_5692 [Cymbomonas tetramitiformis]
MRGPTANPESGTWTPGGLSGRREWPWHTVDRFAPEVAAQLPRYYPRWYNPGVHGRGLFGLLLATGGQLGEPAAVTARRAGSTVAGEEVRHYVIHTQLYLINNCREDLRCKGP